MLALVAALVLASPAAIADPVGPVTKLPLPRFASLKTDRVNLREGPSKDHATKWVYERAGLPVEITAEFEIWRKVRDSEGVEGWVLHSLLSGRRTGLVMPTKRARTRSSTPARPHRRNLAATLQSGVIVNLRNCDGAWCLVDGDGFKGYIEQERLWGVYPGEKVRLRRNGRGGRASIAPLASVRRCGHVLRRARETATDAQSFREELFIP